MQYVLCVVCIRDCNVCAVAVEMGFYLLMSVFEASGLYFMLVMPNVSQRVSWLQFL